MFANSNHRQFQKGLDTDKARASRRDVQLSLRRKTREAHLQKKKRMISHQSVSHNSGIKDKVPPIEEIPQLIVKVMSSDLNTQLQGVHGLRLLLSIERDPPTQRIVRSGTIPKIINFMYSDWINSNTNNKNILNNQDAEIKKKIQFEAAWLITNICAGTTQHVVAMVNAGAIKGFADLLRNADSAEMAEQAVWGLGNIIGEGRKFNEQIFASGVIKDFVQIITDSVNVKVEVLRNCLWALSNFCRSSKSFELSRIKFLISALCKILKETKDTKQQSDALWCCAYLSLQNDDICRYLSKCGAVTIAMKFLHQETAKYQVAYQQSNSQQKMHKNEQAEDAEITLRRTAESAKNAQMKMNYDIYRPATRMIGNLLSGDDYVTQAVLDAGYLDVIYPFVTHFTSSTRKETMWSLSNICAGSHQQIEAVLSRPKVFEAVIQSATSDVNMVRLEACYCICNTTVDCIAAQKKKLADYGSIEALVGILKNQQLSRNSTVIILEGLEAFLATYGERKEGTNFNPYADRVEECGGLDVLEQLMGDDKLNDEIYHMLANILQKYWICEEDTAGLLAGADDDQKTQQEFLTAAVDAKTNQFKFGCGGAASTMSTAKSVNTFQATSSGQMAGGAGATSSEQFAF